MACAALWVGIGGLIIARFDAPLVGAFVVASGLCYAWARIGNYPVAFGSAPFVASDFFGVSALIATLWGGHVADDRNRFLGRAGGGWRYRFAHRHQAVAAEKEEG